MSLNTSHSNDLRGVVIYNGERILLYTKEVVLSFEKVTSGQSDFHGKKKGKLYLTTHRIIFVNQDPKDRMLSFAIPFHCMDAVKLEQPILGANYIHGLVEAQPNGGWEGSATFRLTFDKGGCIDFGKTLLQAHRMARSNGTFAAPPPYEPPGAYSEPPPQYCAYGPPPGASYGWVHQGQQAFPDNPDVVYMYNAAPPYPGIDPNVGYAPPAPQRRPAGACAKEQEAFGQAPAYPGNQASAPMAPPSYEEAMRR